MWQTNLLHATVGAMLFVLRLFGFWPYFYDWSQQRYRTRWFLLCYPLIVWLVLQHLFRRSGKIVFGRTRFHFRTVTASIVIQLFRIACAAIFSSNYLLQFAWFGSIERELRCANRLLHDIAGLNEPHDGARSMRCGRSVGAFLLKAVLLPLAVFMLDCQRTLRVSLSVHQHYDQVALLLVMFAVIGLVPNVHAAAMLAAGMLFGRLNEEMAAIVRASCELAEPTAGGHFRRMRGFCALSDRLDRVAELHRRLTQLTRRVHRMFGATLLLWLMYKSLDGLMRAFMAYVFANQWLQEAQSIPVLVIVVDVLVTLLAWLDVFLLARICVAADNKVRCGQLVCFASLTSVII